MSPSRQQGRGIFGARAEQLRELLCSVGADVEDLLVDAHRELRVGVAEQVHRAPRLNAELGEDRGEGAAEAVRRQVSNRPPERLVRARTRGLDDVLADVLRRLPVALAREEERALRRQVVVCEVVEQDVVERRHEWDDTLARVGLDARDDEPAAGQIDMATVEHAELRDPEAGEHEDGDDRRPRDVVAAPHGTVDPDLVAADLADQRVRDLVVTAERKRRLLRCTDCVDVVPRQAAMLVLKAARGSDQRDRLVELEERPLRRLRLHPRVTIDGDEVEQPAALRVPQHAFDAVHDLVDRATREAARLASVILASA